MNLFQSNILTLLNHYPHGLSDDQIYWAIIENDKSVLMLKGDDKYELIYKPKDRTVEKRLKIELERLKNNAIIRFVNGDYLLDSKGYDLLEEGGLTAELKGLEYSTLLDVLNALQSDKSSLHTVLKVLPEEALKSIVAAGLKKFLGIG
ncbi:hypothetical protein [Mannheimia pernigra]|uniref:hypothetical protein n=1 Tax=Mannheimia pernigra TaxID=111844 RepID=UPI001316E934|nr:hypothetical protein [Mannheimia pernigra]QHB17884.1 hypothetical protein GM695_07525 [Mannheimia pernigra]